MARDSDVGYFEKENKYDKKNVSMKIRMRVSELYDEFLLRLNSKVILQNDKRIYE